MISSVDMEASWSSSASSTAIAAGAGADDDINRLIARNGGVRVGWGFVAAALDLLWKKMRSGGLDLCWKKMAADGRWPKQTCALCSLPGWPDPRPVRIRAQDCLPRAYGCGNGPYAAHHMMSEKVYFWS
jgi:hypothetical protein